MGADSTIVFYGVRYATVDSESGQLQKRTDPRIVRAREHRLAHWWGNFSIDELNEQTYLFVGTLIGHVGHEGEYELSLRDDDLLNVIRSTREKLSEAGFTDEPRFFIQFEPDY